MLILGPMASPIEDILTNVATLILNFNMAEIITKNLLASLNFNTY